MKIGYRTIKTAIGVFLAIAIAQLLDLQFSTSAGVLTMLCIQSTRKKSLKNAYSRFTSCMIGFILAFLIFSVLGYQPWSVLLLILVFVPILVRLRFQETVVSSFIIVFHLYSVQKISLSFIANEVSLFLIGIVIGLIMNLYIPDMQKEIIELQKKIEFHFEKIMKEMVIFLRNHESSWGGKELIETPNLLNQAKNLAIQANENQIFQHQDPYYGYIDMREKQFEILEGMVSLVSKLDIHVKQGSQIADFLEELSNNIHPGNTAHIFLEKIEQMEKEMDEQELPKTRDEFKIRAILYYFIQEMKRYLILKKEYRS